MKKKLDYDEIVKESRRLGITPYLLIKRKINYRKKKFDKICCLFCSNRIKIDWCNDERIQCKIICGSRNLDANIKDNYVCDYIKIKGVKK